MSYVRKGLASCKRAEPPQLPLFAHAESISRRELPLPARRLARRWGLSASTALAVAELAGFTMERE
jgi:hypothetical protein